MSADDLITIQNCSVQDVHGMVLPTVTWSMKKGESWLVIGKNGSGKSAFLEALSADKEIVPNENAGFSLYSSVFTDSVEIVSLDRAAAIIEEERSLDESEYMDRIDEGRTARRFICEVLGGPDARHRHDPLPALAARLESLPEVKLCGVQAILDRGLRYLSTGEIRRTLLCRALLSGKKLLILSDPFSGLDAATRAILFDFFQTAAERQQGSSDRIHIILGMERYTEIPQSITHVLEFSGKAVSFCGETKDYQHLVQQREASAAAVRESEKTAFAAEFNSVCTDTAAFTGTAVCSEKTLIQMNHVTVGWDGHTVLSDFNWSVLPGEHWLIRGPNGSGKTTLLELITGDNMQVFCNDVWLFGKKRGTGETLWDIRSKLGIVSYRLHVEYRMVGGVDLESVIISGFHDSIGLYEQKTDGEIAAAARWLKLAGFETRAHETFGSLSYGEQRAVLIMRAAVKQPPVLILDEPCHGLDEQYRQKILDLLETIAGTGNSTLLHVTHDPDEVLASEKHILELHPGAEPMYRIVVRK
jgi:molybdate transport system ATP-binding protein